MSALDRVLVWFARQMLTLLQLRFDHAKERVWFIQTATYAPRRVPITTLLDGGLPPKCGMLRLGFGAPNNLYTIYMTRAQQELLRDGLIDVLKIQDRQYQQWRSE